MRRLQILYALFCVLWAAYFIRGQINFYLTNATATLWGPVICIAAFVVAPVVFGCLLLFMAFPWFGRLVRR